MTWLCVRWFLGLLWLQTLPILTQGCGRLSRQDHVASFSMLLVNKSLLVTIYRPSITMSDWNAGIIAEFRRNHGKVGGQFERSPLLLFNHTGARTGKHRTNPVMYFKYGDRH